MSGHALHSWVPSPLSPGWELCRTPVAVSKYRTRLCGATRRVGERPAPAQEGSGTSVAAARRIEPVRENLRQRVYQAVREAHPGGLTEQEIEDATGLPGNTVRPRIVELVNRAGLVDSGRTRKTRSGREAVVWIIL